MIKYRNLRPILGALGAAMLLAGCWSYQPPLRGDPISELVTVSRLQAAAPQSPSDFQQALVADYASYSSSLAHNDRDWADADYFARKGLAANAGHIAPPENNANWLIPLEVPEHFRTQLAEYRVRLVTALDNGGRERLPAVAARAQVSYDCWVERMEDDWRTAIAGPCRQQFLDALAQLEGKPAVGAREFRVYFEFDRANLLPEAQQILRQVAAEATKDPNLKILLVGKADRAGTDTYNLDLSHRRADSVRAQLERDGVPSVRIDERWVGEREPPVPTPDGVREPRNRVVEITLQ